MDELHFLPGKQVVRIHRHMDEKHSDHAFYRSKLSADFFQGKLGGCKSTTKLCCTW